MVLWLVMGTSGLSAAERDSMDDDAGKSQVAQTFEVLELGGAWQWLESQRDGLSRNVTSMGSYLDDWLAGERIADKRNESYLRLGINQRVGRHRSYQSAVEIGGRLDLPQATERWKLIFDFRTEERRSLQEQRVGDNYPSSFTGGFSYEMEEVGGAQFSHDIGLRAGIPLDPFYRFRSYYGSGIGTNWHAELDHRLFYYHLDGWGQEARVHLSRDIGTNFFLRIDSQVNYAHERREVEVAQSVSLNQSLGRFETLRYEVGVIGGNRPESRVEDYYGQLRYRNAIHEDWLVMEVVPQLLAERETGWKLDPRLQMNLEVYFYDF